MGTEDGCQRRLQQFFSISQDESDSPFKNLSYKDSAFQSQFCEAEEESKHGSVSQPEICQFIASPPDEENPAEKVKEY